MEESTSSPDEANSSTPLNKKRKLQNEPQESPLPKHVCCDQAPKSNSSSDCESAKDSNSLQCDTDSAMSTDIEYETKTDDEYFNIHGACSDEPYNKIGVDSSESESLAASSSTCFGRLDCSLYQYEPQNPTLEEYDCSCSEYRNDGLENCSDSEIENLLFSNGITTSNYVLSSGRWSINQDIQQESRKPTIDKEFEQYFSMLML
ncbi:hypothetical protein PHJA_001296300 [Phtheirospermum japonicum]|uniref:Uncharacterized protein n=1 Tax=Phtheirospermum japonicum TaxID=374723 RepID=A0A830C611_9LAMI|nr:hypothetical protein PHJA_001296300 [Phtheirospermum japonicum]